MYPDSEYADTSLLALHGSVLVVLAGLTGYLFSGRPSSCQKAHWIGVLIFGLPALLLAVKYYTSLLDAAQAENEVNMMLVMSSGVFGFFVLMIVYGLFIPNDWGQASLLVSVRGIDKGLTNVTSYQPKLELRRLHTLLTTPIHGGQQVSWEVFVIVSQCPSRERLRPLLYLDLWLLGLQIKS